MSDPVTWMYIGAAALQATSVLSGAEGQALDAEAEGKVAKWNAEAASAQAGQAEDAKRKANREFLGRQRAAFGENAINPDTGTAVKVQEQSAIAAELDALNIRYEGVLARTNYLNQARAGRARARNIRLSGLLAAGGSALSTGAGAFGGGMTMPGAGAKAAGSAGASGSAATTASARPTMGPY